jgi:hypothetical protein
MKKFTIWILAPLFVIVACNHSAINQGKITIESEKGNPFDQELTPFFFNPDSLISINFNQDLKKLSIQELRILRSQVFARNGQLLKESELRGYLAAKYDWYDSITTEIWLRIGDKVVEEPVISKTEKDFIKKIDATIEEKQKENFSKEFKGLGNVKNIVNLMKFNKLPKEFMDKLQENNFVLFEERYPQLFNIYEENDYSEIPNFVTSDLYLQVTHMYFSYLFKSLEKNQFIPKIINITGELARKAGEIAQSSSNTQIRELAEFNQLYFAIPFQILSGKTTDVPVKYKEVAGYEINNIINASNKFSQFIPDFNFLLFKPRGHYTRNDTTKNYFRAMIWLQTVPFCREKNETLLKAMFMAFLLNSSDEKVKEDYLSMFETISFLIGEPDNLSISDIAQILKAQNIDDIEKLTETNTIADVSIRLANLVKDKNRIKPKIVLTCPDKINFLPQRYVFDNEILQELVDTTKNAVRAFPKGLDVFAVLGNKTSEELLLKTYKEEANWSMFTANLEKLKTKFKGYSAWDKAVYNKWFESLVTLQTKTKEMPSFMLTDAWDRKTLNTSLASWAELKHDAILYAEQPNAAEMGGGPYPPDPIVKGYVEPNEAFWDKLIQMINLSESLLKKHDLLTEDLQNVSRVLSEQITFMLKATQKELKNENLTDDEYKYIRNIGGHVDNLTLSLLEPDKKPYGWYEVLSPDTNISVIADVYNRNIPRCPKNGVLYEAVGPVHSIYTVVEINGFLYLTRGAVFNHYEFVVQDENRLTDEDWQIKVVTRELPEENNWVKDLKLNPIYKPEVDAKQNYMPNIY